MILSIASRIRHPTGDADCRLPIADCRLPIADCRLPIADCRLPIADCRLPIADWLRLLERLGAYRTGFSRFCKGWRPGNPTFLMG
jgi:hypothetical protein